jgi:exodeoxyribonuclease V alpha subunit
VFSSDEDNWSVVRIAISGRRDLVTAVGHLVGVQAGESLRLSGEWVRDPKYGDQFRVSTFVTLRPSTLLGIEKYLGSGMVPGIGPVMAARLVQKFGLSTLEVIDTQPQRLAEVEGIGKVRSEAIASAWAAQRHVREIMVFLQAHGISAAWASRIHRAYGARAVAVLRDNPYRLAEDIHGIGFATADRIASGLGVASDSPKRIEAGILHSLRRLTEEGNVFAPRRMLIEEASRLLAAEGAPVEDALGRLLVSGDLIADTVAGVAEPALYLAPFHVAERAVAARLAALARDVPSPALTIDTPRAIAWFEERRGIKLASQQREAVARALSGPLLVITGGPGTGKTTLIDAVVRILEAKGLRIALCAPTGRAARRLKDTTGRDAKTIHRLLEFNPRQGLFERHAGKPLEADLVIADEASMIDLLLARHLTEAIPQGCRLILVGDADQLPSVGPGNVLADLLRCPEIGAVRLTEIFRQAEASSIVVNAHRILHGEMPQGGGTEEGSDFFTLRREQPEEVLEAVKSLVRDRLPRRFGLDPVNDIQVLTPMNRGLLGAARLNSELQALLNPRASAPHPGGRPFAPGDKVMQVRNNYDLEVFNGDIGRVIGVAGDGETLEVAFDGRRVAYAPGQADDLVLAYACTVHKAQGSEYPAVIIPLHTQHYVMLQRNLLYTAVTRGRRAVVIVGNTRALAMAVKNDRRQVRHTALADRLRRALTIRST